MDLVEKFANRIDRDSGYDNLSLAQDLIDISICHHKKNLPMLEKVRDFAIAEKEEASKAIARQNIKELPNVKYFQGREDVCREILRLIPNII